MSSSAVLSVNPPSPPRFHRFVPGILFASSLCVYGWTLCPTIFAGDGGKVATAIATGDTIHPPGHPLYWLLGQMLIKLIGVGEPAWRLGLVSSLAGAGAAALTYSLTLQAGARQICAITASVAFALSICLWQQSTEVGTYALGALFIPLILTSAAKYAATAARRDLIATALCCGLSLANQLSAACVIVGAAWLISSNVQREKKPVIAAFATMFALVLPLGLYGVVWITYQPAGWPRWAGDSVFHHFLGFLAAPQSIGYLAIGGVGDVSQRILIDLPTLLWQNMGWFLVAVVPGAACGLWMTRTRRLHQAMLITGVLYLLEASGTARANIFDYYTPLILLLCVWGGVGMDGVIVGITRRLSAPLAATRVLRSGICVCLTLTALITHWSSCDHSKALFIRNFAINTLRGMPENAVLVVDGDDRADPIRYVQEVLDVRPDVTLVPRKSLELLSATTANDELSWTVEKISTKHPTLVDANAIATQSMGNRSYAQQGGPTWDIVARALKAGFPVFMCGVRLDDTHPGKFDLPILTHVGSNLTLSPLGLAQQIVPVRDYPNLLKRIAANLAVQSQMRIDAATDDLMAAQPDKNFTNVAYAKMLDDTGNLLLRAGNFSGAYVEYREALSLDPTPLTMDDLSYVCMRTDKTVEALQLVRGALELDPGNQGYQTELRADQLALANRVQTARR